MTVIQTNSELKLEDHCRDTVLGLRGALLDLYRSVGADPSRPQDVSRRFQLNKNLAWKISRVIQTEDALAAVPLIPGPGGLSILLKALQAGGAPAPTVDRVRSAVAAYDDMIEIHTGDRATLQLVLDSMGAGRQLEMSRKLAYQGNSGLWGIRAGVRSSTFTIAPSKHNSDMLDIGLVGGLTNVHRLRSIDRWPAFQRYRVQTDVTDDPGRHLAIADSETDDRYILRSCCSGVMPPVHVTDRGGMDVYEFGPGPVGLTGEFSMFMGFLDRQTVPRWRDGDNTQGEFVCSVTTPVEHLLVDIFVHRDIPEALSLKTRVLGWLGASLANVASLPIPIAERVHDLGENPVISTPLIENYDDVVEALFDRGQWDRREFRCLRLVMKYPPMSSRTMLTYDLPAAPSRT
ncbi:MAG: hypothetical protein DHS20C14_01580 [Phycisphaeraceae bacterium]|nr:MAG: hypothetical protein DHS20C14_01580 [Phycisphaeraceae bacterium]